MAMKDDLGDRMKTYERIRTAERFDPDSIIYARIDGRGFSKFTKGMNKPFDAALKHTMVDVTSTLVQKTHALIGYTQSDEISLAWLNSDGMFFDRKIQKITSVLASMTTAHFILYGQSYIEPQYFSRYPHFDARAFEIPSKHELTNAFFWRYKDAYRNAIMMIAQSIFSHKELQNKNIKTVKQMLDDVGVSEYDYEQGNVHGTFIRRETVLKEREEEYVVRDAFVPHEFAFSDYDHRSRYEFIIGEAYDE